MQSPEQPPVSTSLKLSSPLCAIDGNPPFTISTTYACNTSRPIWALFPLFTYFCGGIKIRDPARNHRRIGPDPTFLQEVDLNTLNLEDTLLVRLEPEREHSTSYTLAVVPKANGILHSDVHMFVKGHQYEVTLRKRQLRWMFEDEMPDRMTEAERRELLKEKAPLEWRPDCCLPFEAT